MEIRGVSWETQAKAEKLVKQIKSYRHYKRVIRLYLLLLGLRGVGKKTIKDLLKI